MDKLPPFALEEIALFLDPRTAFCHFAGAAKRIYSEMRSGELCNRYLAAVFRLPFQPRVEWSVFTQALVQGFSASNAILNFVEMTGFATSGGVDSEQMRYWVGNMFTERSLKAYCSRENKNNIVCAGVLSTLQPENGRETLETARKEVAAILRSNHRTAQFLARTQTPDNSEPLTVVEEDFFLRVFSRALVSFYPDTQDPQERLSLFTKVGNLAAALAAAVPTWKEVARRPEDPFALEMGIDKEGVRRAEVFFATREVRVSREGRYTCPVETFMVFVSMDFVELECEEFTKFDNLQQSKDVYEVASAQHLTILNTQESSGVIYHEFSHCSGALQPVIWGKFLSRDCTLLDAHLSQVFTGKYLYAKLINPESRMQEMRDLHEFTNIDAKFVGVRGNVIRLQ